LSPARLLATGRAVLQDEERRFVLLNSLGGVTWRVLGMALTMAVTAVYTRLLGVEDYGRFAFMVSSSFVVVLLAGLGLPVASSRLVPRYRTRLRHEMVAHYILTGLVLTAIAALISGLALQALLNGVPGAFAEYHFPTAMVVALVVAVALVRFLSETSRGCGLQQVGFLTENVIVRLALLLGLGLFLVAGASLDAESALGLWVMAQVVGAVGLTFAILRRVRPSPASLRPRPFRLYRSWLQASFVMLITPVYYFLLFETDALILGTLAGPAEVGLYQIARRLAELAVFCASAVSSVGLPRLAGAHAARRPDQLQSVVDTMNVVAVGSTAGVVLVLVGLGPWLLQLFGPEFVAGYVPLLILTVGRLVAVLFGPASDLLLMTGHHGRLGRVNLAFAAINLALCLTLIPLFGAGGAAWATALTLVGWSAWLYRLAKQVTHCETCLLRRRTDLLRALRAPPG
jgi:O-antigen/teichoic acid export membrane protein